MRDETVPLASLLFHNLSEIHLIAFALHDFTQFFVLFLTQLFFLLPAICSTMCVFITNQFTRDSFVPASGRLRKVLPSKPAKYGLKFWQLCDSSSFYCYNAIFYCGKDEERPTNVSLGQHVVVSCSTTFWIRKKCDKRQFSFVLVLGTAIV